MLKMRFKHLLLNEINMFSIIKIFLKIPFLLWFLYGFFIGMFALFYPDIDIQSIVIEIKPRNNFMIYLFWIFIYVFIKILMNYFQYGKVFQLSTREQYQKIKDRFNKISELFHDFNRLLKISKRYKCLVFIAYFLLVLLLGMIIYILFHALIFVYTMIFRYI